MFLGFVKFLKRDKKKEPKLDMDNAADLDTLPPPPDFGGKLPELDVPPQPGEDLGKLPELPELPDIEENVPEEKPLSDLDFPKESDLDLPPLPDFGTKTVVEEPKLPPRPLFGMKKPLMEEIHETKPEMIMPRPEIKHYEKLERVAVTEGRAILQHKEAKGPIYIRIDRFRNILSGTSDIKNNLKTASESITKMDEIDENRDKVFDKWHNIMMDLQKKLIFVDKTLFKR